MLKSIKSKLNKLKNKQRAIVSAMFFKTGKGQYGFGDVFLGIPVLDQRRVAREFKDISLSDLKELLFSKVHEYRFTALEILVLKYELSNGSKNFVDFYLRNRKGINNWDLVDTSAPYILGDFLRDKKDRSILYKLASSKILWDRRIAVVSTLAFIKEGDFKDILKLANILMGDEEELVLKAIGWMLREVYKKDKKVLEKFLDQYASKMKRVSLRYCIEKMPKKSREHYMNL